MRERRAAPTTRPSSPREPHDAASRAAVVERPVDRALGDDEVADKSQPLLELRLAVVDFARHHALQPYPEEMPLIEAQLLRRLDDRSEGDGVASGARAAIEIGPPASPPVEGV